MVDPVLPAPIDATEEVPFDVVVLNGAEAGRVEIVLVETRARAPTVECLLGVAATVGARDYLRVQFQEEVFPLPVGEECRQRSRWVPLPPRSPVPRSPPGGAETVLRPARTRVGAVDPAA